MSISKPETAVRALYHAVLTSWNECDAAAFAGHFSAECNVIGFDGSLLDGAPAIESSLAQIFAHHQTAPYVGIVRVVRQLSDDVMLLSALVGMVLHGKTQINPAVNAIQTLVAARQRGTWRITLLQTTPAAFHGQPEAQTELTSQLQSAYIAHGLGAPLV